METTTAVALVERAELTRPGEGAMLGAFLANKRSAQTRRAYGADLSAFASFMGEISKDPGSIARALLKATIVEVVAWRNTLAGQAPASIARRLAALRMFYRFAKAAGVATMNPAEAVEAPRIEAERQKRPSLEAPQARQLLDAPDRATLKGKRDRAILGLLASSGLRRAEVCGLKAADLHSDPSGLTVTVEGKGGKVRTVEVDRETGNALLAYLNECIKLSVETGEEDLPYNPDEALFHPTANPRHAGDCSGALTVGAINLLVEGYAVRAGFGAAPHALRRTFATVALDRGATIEALRRTLGHADPRTTARYDRRRATTLTVTY